MHNGHNDSSGTQLDTYDGEDATTGQHPAELDRYEEDEVATAPWPPRVS